MYDQRNAKMYFYWFKKKYEYYVLQKKKKTIEILKIISDVKMCNDHHVFSRINESYFSSNFYDGKSVYI